MQAYCPLLDRTTAVTSTPYRRGDWSVVRCEETDFVFLANPPDYSRLESEFAWEKTFLAERARREQEEPIAKRVSAFAKRLKLRWNPKRNKIARLADDFLRRRSATDIPTVLDIGCGGGGLLVHVSEEARQRNQSIVPIGIEVSRQLALDTEARLQRFDGRVIQANAVDGVGSLPAASVDLVLMSSFLEHECQPFVLLQRLRNALRPGAAVILKVPNFDCWNRRIRHKRWSGFRYPDHVNYFTPATLRLLADQTGMHVAQQRLRDRSPLSDNMYAVLKRAA